MSDSFFIEGLPIGDRTKTVIVTSSIILAVLNHLLPAFSMFLDYAHRNTVSVILIAAFLIFSIGSKTAETIVIGTAIVAIVSNVWDFTVSDISDFRRKLLMYSFVILTIAVLFGEVSVLKIIKKQLGG